MKKLFSCLFALLLFLTIALSTTVADDNSPVIRVGFYENAPKIFTGEKGIVTGFWPDLIRYIADRENWQIKWVPGTWSQGLERLKNGEINIMPDTGWTEPRSRKYTFSTETVLASWSRVYVPQKSEIKSIIDLKGKIIAALKGSVNLEGPGGIRQILHEFNLSVTFKEMESYEQVFEALKTKEIDAGVTNKDFGNRNENKYAVERTPIIFQPVRVQFAFTKDGDLTPFLVKKIDIHMKRLKGTKNSIYYQVLEKYIGDNPAKPFVKVIPGWIKMAAAIGCAVILFLLAVGLISRMQVKQRTSELGESEKRFKTLSTLTFEGILIHQGGVIQDANEAITRLTGYTREELIGENIIQLCVLPDYHAVIQKNIVRKLAFPYEIMVQRKDGTIFPAEIEARDITEENKEFRVAAIRDITERKKAEKETINAQNFAGEQKKLALVGQIAGKMAHDFNNILGIIMGNAELALLTCKDGDLKKTLELIFKQTIRGRNLTRNLVAFAKDQEPRQEFFKISEKIDLVLNLLKKDLEGVELIKQDSPGIPDLLADSGMIEHALINLIQNSIHAISLVEHPRIIIRTDCIEDNIYFKIEDNGCGIPEKSLTKIYEPSFTLKGSKDVSASYKAGIKGTGYGMANVKKYIEQHRGDILVESKIGAGTKFTIRLPVIKKELTREEIRKLRDEKIYSGKYVLLVEDETDISGVLYKILSQEPCRHFVDIATDGQAAMELFKKNNYDVISLDYVLPGEMNGMDVYHHIRQINHTIPILFVSGNIEFLESIKELKQKDAHIDHLSKPCRNKDYVACINKLLDSNLTAQE